jgi:hypothetical protein
MTEQKPETESKKCNIVLTSSNAHPNIVMNNKLPYYISGHAKYFDNWNPGKLQLLTKWYLKLDNIKMCDEVIGVSQSLWDVMFHQNM